MTGGLDIQAVISENVTAALAEAERRGGDLTPAMGEISRHMVTQAELRFRTEKSPAGVPWKQSARAKEDGGQTLTLHGDLRRSIREDFGRDFAAAGPEASGGAAVYAAIHQFGGTIRPRAQADGTPHVMTRALNTPFGPRASVTIPAREYMGFTAEDGEATLEILADHFRPPFAQGATA